jgi:hypothetical protein
MSDSKAVTDEATGGRSATEAGAFSASCFLDDVVNEKEVGGKSELIDNRKLVLKSSTRSGIRGGVKFSKPVESSLMEPAFCGLVFGKIYPRELPNSQGEFEVRAPFDNGFGLMNGLRDRSVEGSHRLRVVEVGSGWGKRLGRGRGESRASPD